MGRSTSDNIVIGQEAIHSMKTTRSKKGWMAIKVDLEKAYDRICWDFIKDSLKDVGFPISLVNVIMHCITTKSMQVL